MKKNTHSTDFGAVETLLAVMAKLRDPDEGCPWDMEQSFRSIVPYTLEEAYEVADAIERNNLEDLKEELGDLLLQVVFHARMAEEEGAFTFADVVDGIVQKMIRRHPHVFSKGEPRSADEVAITWEEIKESEKAMKGRDTLGLLDDVPVVLPGLAQAVKLQKKAAKVGFDWPDIGPVLEKVEEELSELKHEVDANAPDAIEEEFGDLLFVLANYARHLKIDPDAALRRANQKFRTRFASMELNAKAERVKLENLELEELEALWLRAKEEEKKS